MLANVIHLTTVIISTIIVATSIFIRSRKWHSGNDGTVQGVGKFLLVSGVLAIFGELDASGVLVLLRHQAQTTPAVLQVLLKCYPQTPTCW